MKKALIVVVAAVVVAGGGAAVLHAWPTGNKPTLEQMEGNVERGAYLARMSGCIACHTNAEGGGAPLAGGLALKTDFGTFYSPNLTTDEQHGIGNWTPDMFARAVRQGISPDGEPYYPAFPYTFYTYLSDQDIADLWAAFQTVPPVAERSKAHDLPFPFSFRPGLKVWRALFMDNDPLETVEAKGVLWNRGRFVVEGPAHCGACHTPRNLLGATRAELSLHGADDLPDGGKSPPITAGELRKNGWTVSNLKYALKSGIMPDGDTFGGSMGEVVRDGTSFLADSDLTAIATYLLDKDLTDEN